jgi:hypothetical protein
MNSSYLDLNIEHRLRVDLEPQSDLHVMRKSLLISLLDLSPLFHELLVVDVSQQALELVQIFEPDAFGKLEGRTDEFA